MPLFQLEDAQAAEALMIFLEHVPHDVEPVGSPLVFFEAQLRPQMGLDCLANRSLKLTEVNRVISKVLSEELTKLGGEAGRQQQLKD